MISDLCTVRVIFGRRKYSDIYSVDYITCRKYNLDGERLNPLFTSNYLHFLVVGGNVIIISGLVISTPLERITQPNQLLC